MTEQELRQLVRDAIARHGHGAAPSLPSQSSLPSVAALRPHHASHAMFVIPAGAEENGACVIEPAVSCNHCGYCKSYGH